MDIDQIKEKPINMNQATPNKSSTPHKSVSDQILSQKDEASSERVGQDGANLEKRPQLNFEFDQNQ